MRDILGDLEAAERLMDPNPMRRAQKAMLTPMPKRFYKEADVAEREGQFVVVLDGKPVKTPARMDLAFSTKAAAALVASEFAAQEKEINPATMPYTRLANTAIDGVAKEVDAVLVDIQRFGANDMLCYRSEAPEGLVKRQTLVWDPYLSWVRSRYGVHLHLTQGVMHVEQPIEAIAAFGVALQGYRVPLPLACLHAMTTITGSAILALAVADGEVALEEAWAAAHLDEDWMIEFWGEDREASERRVSRWIDMEAASQMLKAALAP